MRIQCLVIVVTLCFTLISLPPADAATPDETVLQAGAAISNITPPISLDPVAQSKRPPATHVHDELHARCLVLDDGEVRLALVVCDLRHMSAEVAANAKQLIQSATGIPPESVLISATHTHTSSGARLEEGEGESYYDYKAFLARRIAEGVLRSVNQLEPARIGWGVVEEPTQVFNRRWFLMPGRGIIYGAHDNIEHVDTNPGYTGLLRPAGPVDPQITFLSVQSTSGTCHPPNSIDLVATKHGSASIRCNSTLRKSWSIRWWRCSTNLSNLQVSKNNMPKSGLAPAEYDLRTIPKWPGFSTHCSH